MTMASNSEFKILLLVWLISGFCVTSSVAISDDCNYIGSMIVTTPKLVVDFIGCIADPTTNFLVPNYQFQNFVCVMKCTLIKGGMLDEDGSVDAVGALEFLGGILPPQAKDKADTLVTDCQDSLSLVNLTDTSCMSYVPMITCALGSIIKIFVEAGLETIPFVGKTPIDPFKAFNCLLNFPSNLGGGYFGEADDPEGGEDGETGSDDDNAVPDDEGAKRLIVPIPRSRFPPKTPAPWGRGSQNMNQALNNLNRNLNLTLELARRIVTAFIVPPRVPARARAPRPWPTLAPVPTPTPSHTIIPTSTFTEPPTSTLPTETTTDIDSKK